MEAVTSMVKAVRSSDSDMRVLVASIRDPAHMAELAAQVGRIEGCLCWGAAEVSDMDWDLMPQDYQITKWPGHHSGGAVVGSASHKKPTQAPTAYSKFLSKSHGLLEGPAGLYEHSIQS